MAKIAVIGIRGLPANYGGLETCAEEICSRWAAEGHEVLVYCRKHRYADRPESLNGVSLRYVTSIPGKSLDTISHTFFCILDLMFRRRDYKRVHLYNTGNAIFTPLLRMMGRHVVLSGDGIEWRRQKWGWLAKTVHKMGEKFAVMFANHIVVDNEEVGAYYQEQHGVTTDLIPYGANEIVVKPDVAPELLDKHSLIPGRYFIFVGRIVPEKGVHDLIDVFKELNTDMSLVIIGDDDTGTQYRDDVFANASNKIKFLGFIYNEDYEQLLLSAYMYLSASRLEGTSPSLLSAMGAGICCLVNGIPENVATIKGAFPTYEANRLEDLKDRWQRLIDNPEEATAYAKLGKQCVRENYSWDAVADDYLKLLLGS